jgi:hypothetical protein
LPWVIIEFFHNVLGIPLCEWLEIGSSWHVLGFIDYE